MIVSLELQRNDEIGPEYDFVRLHVEREATSVAQKAFFLRNEDEGLKPTPCVGCGYAAFRTVPPSVAMRTV